MQIRKGKRRNQNLATRKCIQHVIHYRNLAIKKNSLPFKGKLFLIVSCGYVLVQKSLKHRITIDSKITVVFRKHRSQVWIPLRLPSSDLNYRFISIIKVNK